MLIVVLQLLHWAAGCSYDLIDLMRSFYMFSILNGTRCWQGVGNIEQDSDHNGLLQGTK